MTRIRSETPLLIVFTDLTRCAAQCLRHDNVEIADVLDAYYERVAAAVDAAGGVVVKFIGDGSLIVFPEHAVDHAVGMLLELKNSIDRFMTERGWECRFTAKVHFGTAMAGLFGAAGAKRYDVIGKDVNTAAMLDSAGLTLSVEPFRKLSRDMRTHFKKHTPPVTYLRIEDPRPFRWKRGRVSSRVP
jgi:adenylate cyclase